MNINPFIQTAFGAIAGGLVVIATNWLAARSERKKQSQEWWAQQYVTEGIDYLITYLKSIQLYGASMNVAIGNNPPLLAKPQELPLAALTRIESFLGMDLSGILVFAYLASGSENDKQKYEALAATTKILDMLYQLRREILRNLGKINSRYHNITITHQYDQAKTDLRTYLEKVYDELVQGIMEGAEECEENPEAAEEADRVVIEAASDT